MVDVKRDPRQDKHLSIDLPLLAHSKFGLPLLRISSVLCLFGPLVSIFSLTSPCVPIKKHVYFMGLSPVKAFQSTHIHSGRLLSFLGRLTYVCEAQNSDERGTLVLFNCVLARLGPISSFSLETFCIILQYSYCAVPGKLRSAGTLCRSLAWNLRALRT